MRWSASPARTDKIALVRGPPSGSQAIARDEPPGRLETNAVVHGRARVAWRARVSWRARVLGVFLTAAVALSLTGLASDAFAAPGDLDTTFSEDGKVLTDFRGRHDEARDVARQGDGKLVAVGGAGGNFAVARYNPDGSLDRGFDGNGRKMADFGSAFDGAAAVAVQPDGKIVVAGHGGGKVALARYRPNGLLDRTFSGDGKETTDFGDGSEANDLNVAASGKIVVAGKGSNAEERSR